MPGGFGVVKLGEFGIVGVMAKFVIEGGRKLSGSIPVYGSKNAALPLLAGKLLGAPDTNRLTFFLGHLISPYFVWVLEEAEAWR